MIVYGKVYTALTDGFCVGDLYIWPQWDVVTSNDVKELRGRLSRMCVCLRVCVFVCLRAKWEFGTCVLTARREAPTHVRLYKDYTKTIGSGEVLFLCVCLCDLVRLSLWG